MQMSQALDGLIPLSPAMQQHGLADGLVEFPGCSGLHPLLNREVAPWQDGPDYIAAVRRFEEIQVKQTHGRAVMVTGCSSGIGRCAANGLRERGYRVFATARRDEDLAQLAAEGLEAVRLDLADSESIASAAGQVLDMTGGRLFALFNNAAYGQPGAVEDLPRAALREQFETNLFGTHELTCHFIPAMRARGEGRIIQNSSILGLVAMPYRGAYNASKFALEGLSDTLRQELSGTGIHVVLIEPGPVLSRFRANALAAFRRHVDPTAGFHAGIYQAMLKRLEAEGAVAPFTLPPEAVLRQLVRALEARRPRTRYPVTVPAVTFSWLRRFLPARWMDRMLAGELRATPKG
jgi:NAD(P)-dependent dehydrogenase (short-subunit alcohol dehydrogenase family)